MGPSHYAKFQKKQWANLEKTYGPMEGQTERPTGRMDEHTVFYRIFSAEDGGQINFEGLHIY